MPLTIDRSPTIHIARKIIVKGSPPEKIESTNHRIPSPRKGILGRKAIKIGVQPITPATTNVLATNAETLSSPL